MPTNNPDYHREYMRNRYQNDPEKGKLYRVQYYAKTKYGFDDREILLFDGYLAKVGTIRKFLDEINAEQPHLVKTILERFI